MLIIDLDYFNKKLSIMKASQIFFENVKSTRVSANEYLKFISLVTNRSYESVRESTIGFNYPKLGGMEWFNNSWSYCRSSKLNPAVFIKSKLKVKKVVLGNSYDHDTKQKSRVFVFKDIDKINSPKILTLAGHEGLDVKYILEQNSNSLIYNIEKHLKILKTYQKNKFPTTDINATISEFLRSNTKTFDYIFYDSVSYLCGYIADDLKYINENKTTKILSINLMDMNGIRNHGKFANEMREKFKDHKNKTLSAVKDIMSNYKYLGAHKYKCSGISIGMIILKFELRINE